MGSHKEDSSIGVLCILQDGFYIGRWGFLLVLCISISIVIFPFRVLLCSLREVDGACREDALACGRGSCRLACFCVSLSSPLDQVLSICNLWVRADIFWFFSR